MDNWVSIECPELDRKTMEAAGGDLVYMKIISARA